MTPQEFDKFLTSTNLTRKEQGKAWRLYKTIGPADAIHFVRTVEERLSLLRQNLALRDVPVPYHVWGQEHIENGAINQMIGAARLPIAVAGALMPDAHQGYGLPIGGVLATENAVIPYAVGVDIACRMMLSVYPAQTDILTHPKSPHYEHLKEILINNTVFGAGENGKHAGKIDHPILSEENWKSTSLIRSLRLTAICQIGTSGTGNHFVEWGELEILDTMNPLNLPIGNYLALLSHSGSRGVGYKIANHYTQLAMTLMPELDQAVKHLAWLPLDSEAGQEYWEAMQLAGQFASANHQIIHERMAHALGLKAICSIENHHNFAWREKILVNGLEKEVIVHRKGATPAGHGVLGIIPGTMADIGFVVRGKGCTAALNSASHGSGRQMSRSMALRKITPQQHEEYLNLNAVTLIGGGLDEAPQAYKSIHKIIEAQSELIEIIGKFRPRIVRMASDSESEL
jgi:tRNA-splicing ligase RtcB